MTTTETPATVPLEAAADCPTTRHPRRIRRTVGGFYLVMGGINAGIVAADPQTYRTFADQAYWSFVITTWHDIVMAQPYVWFLLLAGGEISLGVLLLLGGRAARWGWAGVLAFHLLLMAFGFGFWLWCLPALALLAPAARADWPQLGGARSGTPTRVTVTAAPSTQSPVGGLHGPPGRFATRWQSLVLAFLVVASSLYGLTADAAYRGLPETTVAGARAQDAVSIVVALLLVGLTAHRATRTPTRLMVLGLLGYLTYSYLIYLSGVPMNRMFLAYVAIVAVSGASLARGLVDVVRHPPTSGVTARLRTITGWVLLATAVLFAGLWLATLLPYAFGGAPVEPEGVGGTPYPVFWLDLAIVLPAIGAVAVTLLRRRAIGPALAVVALVKIVTLFTALWAGPAVALVTNGDVALGPDAVPSLMLLAGSVWMLTRWLPTFDAAVVHVGDRGSPTASRGRHGRPVASA